MTENEIKESTNKYIINLHSVIFRDCISTFQFTIVSTAIHNAHK